MVSFGMLPPLASAIALRRRALASGSPPPERAATVISLINFVNSLPRLASSAPFLCLILCHFECPDIGLDPSGIVGCQGRQYIKDRETISTPHTLFAPARGLAGPDRRLSTTQRNPDTTSAHRLSRH